MDNIELTLLTKEQAAGIEEKKALEVLEKTERVAFPTDLAILTEGNDFFLHVDYLFNASKVPRCWTWTRSEEERGLAYAIGPDGETYFQPPKARCGYIRPVILPSLMTQELIDKAVLKEDHLEVSFGTFPQQVVDLGTNRKLHAASRTGQLEKSNKTYTFDKGFFADLKFGFEPDVYEEYYFEGERYIHFNGRFYSNAYPLSNGQKIREQPYWIKVSPVIWLVDEETGLLISKKALLSGIRLNRNKYDGNFAKSTMGHYFENYLKKALFDTVSLPEKNKILQTNNDLKDFMYRNKTLIKK